MNAANNTLLHEYSYDAWGRMRNTANLTTYSPGSEPVLFVAGRGFTGHEHLPWFNLINMNGRLYDPLTAQFLSPDNYVQDPTFTQNYNRYIYCLNNPLKYVDPSGYKQLKSWEEFWEVINNLMDYGGSWNSETGYSDGRQGGSIEGYGVLSGSGFHGPGQPYMLGEVTITAQAPEKNTPTTPIIDNNNDPFRFDKNDPAGGGGNQLDPSISAGISIGGGFVGGLENSYKYGSNTVKYAQRINGQVRNAQVLTRASQMNAAKMASGLKVVGRGVTGLSVATAGYQFANSDMSGNDYARLTGSLVITGTAFIPLVGPIISIGLGVADSYGAFDGIYNYFE